MARQREFDREAALDQAMDAFWRNGYQRTSIEDLVVATGVKRGSLYAAFGDKEALFLSALERFCEVELGSIFAPLDRPGPRLAAIREMFIRVVNNEEMRRDRRGCMIFNTAMELCPDSGRTGRLVTAGLQTAEAHFRRAIEEARASGELDPGSSATKLARFLSNSLNGLRVMARVTDDPVALRDIVDVVMSALPAEAATRLSGTAR